MFKQILLVILAAVMAWQPLVANAQSLDGIFGDLTAGGASTAINDAGRFSSGARNIYSGGGFDMRVSPSANSANLFSFTPPRTDSGCSGISAFFGGFSFISGKEFEQLLKSIASGAALGFVAHLTMKALCPYCESVAQFLSRLNQVAAQAAKNSCQWGANMAAQAQSSMGISGEGYKAECATGTATAGESKDSLQAQGQAVCTSIDKSLAQLEKFVDEMSETTGPNGETPDKTAALKELKLGNFMWLATAEMFPAKTTENLMLRTWIMNVTGTKLVGSTEKAGFCGASKAAPSGEKKEPYLYCPATGEGMLSAPEIVQIMMCGVENIENRANPKYATINKYCESSPSWGKALDQTKRRYVMVCKSDDYDECMKLEPKELEDAVVDGAKLIDGKGLMYQVRDLLGLAVERVVTNQKLYNSSANGGDENGRRLVRLIQLAPYPLYQAINAAAVYPSASLDMLDSLSTLIGESLAYSYTDQMLRFVGRTQTGGTLEAYSLERIRATMEMMRGYTRERKTLMAQNLVIQESISAQIRQLNIAIQRQVMTTDVLNSSRFAGSLGDSVSGGRAAGSTPASE